MSADQPSEVSTLPSEVETALADYLESVKQTIVAQARQRSGESPTGKGAPSLLDVLRAIRARSAVDLADRLDVDEDTRRVLQTHLTDLAVSIVDEAKSMGLGSGRTGTIAPTNLLKAIATFAPGNRFRPESSLLHRLLASVSGLTVMSLLAAIVFGLLGLWPVTAGTSNGYLEIAKLLVGVVVGSASTGVVRDRA